MNKLLYKIELYLLKVIPMIISVLFLINTILSCNNIDTTLPSTLVAILTWLFLYISSFVFKFCIYHRMFLYYILFVEILNYIDYDFNLYQTNKKAIAINIIIAGIFLFIILYLKIRHEKRIKKSTS